MLRRPEGAGRPGTSAFKKGPILQNTPITQTRGPVVCRHRREAEITEENLRNWFTNGDVREIIWENCIRKTSGRPRKQKGTHRKVLKKRVAKSQCEVFEETEGELNSPRETIAFA